MKKLTILTFLMICFSLSSQNHLVWIEADPDTIFFDNNLTYSTVTALLEDDNNNPVAGEWVYFDSGIGNLLHNIQTDEDGIAETTFWESGDLGVATISVEYYGQYLTTQVTIIMPISADDNEIPLITDLRNYPNPFNPSTTISFSLSSKLIGNPKILIYNMKGQIIKEIGHAELVEAYNPRNTYSIVWDGTDNSEKAVASGIYMCTVKAGNTLLSKKMTLLK
jgi:hypothetical protein